MQEYFSLYSKIHSKYCFPKVNYLGFVLILYFGLITEVFAQEEVLRYGKVDTADLKMNVYERDPEASAVVLHDFAKTRIEVNNDGIPQVITYRHRRIKILKRDGFQYGDISIPLLGKSLYNLNAQTINWSKRKKEITKTRAYVFFDNTVNNVPISFDFSFPAIEVGSILDYHYEVRYGNIYCPDTWYFQEGIPVRWSEYQFIQPMGLDYVSLVTKSKDFHIRDTTIQRFVMTDMRALKEAPYITTMKDHYARMQFQLVKNHLYSGNPSTNFEGALAWKKFSERLLNYEFWGKQIKGKQKNKKIAKDAQLLTLGMTDTLAMVDSIYRFIGNALKFNSISGIQDAYLNNAYKKGSGNGSEINLSFISALRAVGISADPVLISTRDHGKVKELYPIARQFNHVIVQAEIGGKRYHMDAVDPRYPYFLLRENDLNTRGFVVKSAPEWVDIIPQRSVTNHRILLSVNEKSGNWEGKKLGIYENYAAHNRRRKLKEEGKTTYLKQNFTKNPDYQGVAVEFKHQNDPNARFEDEITFQGPDFDDGDFIYLQPITFSSFTKNPFKLNSRIYPIDWAYPFLEVTLYNLKIPGNYIVEELPKEVLIDLLDDSAKFTYNIEESNGYVQLMAKLELNRTLYTAKEYRALKVFLDKVVDKFSEQIVLKKSGK